MTQMANVEELKKISTQVKRDIVRMVHQSQSGHPGGSLGCSDFLVVLYFAILHHNKNFSMQGKNEDIFILSNGHISPVYYSILARSGYFDISELKTFRKINSRLQGHPTTQENLPGIRVSTGSLGQGLSVGIGIALAKKLDNDQKLVYVLTGDGEIQEGQAWEAIMFAGAKKTDNLILTVDYNNQQIDGSCKDVLDLGDLKSKFEAFQWDVIEEKNGNNISDILNTLNMAKTKSRKQKPVVILLHSVMGYGVNFMEGTNKWHGIAPSDEELKLALEQLPETLKDY